ncbi:Uncharacterised protein r2_g1902 [Pycnogonum litorale]
MSEDSTANRSRRCLTNGEDFSASHREREERKRQAREKSAEQCKEEKRNASLERRLQETEIESSSHGLPLNYNL